MPQRHPALVFMCYFSSKKWKSGNFIEKFIGKVEILLNFALEKWKLFTL